MDKQKKIKFLNKIILFFFFFSKDNKKSKNLIKLFKRIINIQRNMIKKKKLRKKKKL